MATHVMATGDARQIRRHRRETPAFLAWLEEIRTKLALSWTWYQAYRQTVRELNSLSNRELDDIGIPRYDIPRQAMQSANKVQDAEKEAALRR